MIMGPITLLGVALMVWVVRDLITGKVYVNRYYTLAKEPIEYWLGMVFWFTVGLMCIT